MVGCRALGCSRPFLSCPAFTLPTIHAVSLASAGMGEPRGTVITNVDVFMLLVIVML